MTIAGPKDPWLAIGTEEQHERMRRSLGWASGEWHPEQMDVDAWLDSGRPTREIQDYTRIEVWDTGDGRAVTAFAKACEEMGPLKDRVRLREFAGDRVDEEEKKARDRLRRRRLDLREADRWAEEVMAARDAATDKEPEEADFEEELALPLPDEPWVVDGLVHDEGRVVIGGFRKAGKTIFTLNLAAAMVTGDLFLDRFAVRKPDPTRTVGWLNLELTRGQARSWVHGLGTWVPPEALRHVAGVHLRGAVASYAITTRGGEKKLADFCERRAVETLLVDPVAPLMAVCGLDVHSGKDVARFLTQMDRIARSVGVRQIVYTAHVAKSSAFEDGQETVKGDTRWEDAVDSIIMLGKEPNSGVRWLRAEGRDVDLDGVTLKYDEAGRKLTLDPLTSRYEAELTTCAQQVLEVVRAIPGIQTEALLGDVRIKGTKAKRKAGVLRAVGYHWIEKRPGPGTAVEHWPLV